MMSTRILKALKTAALGQASQCRPSVEEGKDCAYLAIVILVAITPVRIAHAQVAEPAGYKMDGFRSQVPDGLAGAKTVTTRQAWQLWKAGGIPFIDVMPQAPKPKNLAEGAFWREKTRNNIPGSYWLANVGYGRLHPDVENWFKNRLALLTSGNKDKPVLFYCLMDCWMSWNAAKRALDYGYSNVLWYPDGSDGWRFEGYPLKASYPEIYAN